MEPFHKLLMCGLHRISFPNPETCTLELPEGHCTDMQGAIRVAKSVTKHLDGFRLRLIRTVAAGRDDTYYVLDEGGTWHARMVR